MYKLYQFERNGILFPKNVLIFFEKSFCYIILLFYLLFFRMAFMISARLFWRLWSVWYHFWNENWLTHCHMLWPQHWLIFHRHWWKMLSMFFAGIFFLLQSPMSTTQGFIDFSKLNNFLTKALSIDDRGTSSNIHCVAKVYAVLPFYDVKCLCSGGREWGRGERHSHKHFNIWFLWYKSLVIWIW